MVDGDAQEAHDEGVGDAAEQGGDAEALQAEGLSVLLAEGQEDRHADACGKRNKNRLSSKTVGIEFVKRKKNKTDAESVETEILRHMTWSYEFFFFFLKRCYLAINIITLQTSPSVETLERARPRARSLYE